MSSTTPPTAGSGDAEFLEPEGGEPIKPSRGSSGARRTALIAVGAAVGLALVGGGVWAAMSFFATGPQPAEALPASTVGYASIDLDPSGGQKIEALRMIEKFPALEKELGGVDADDDLLALAFEDLEKQCEGLDYADDVKPWLGYRFAAAAIDLGEERPTPVGVVQVTDAGAAEDGLAELQECTGSDVGGWVIEGEWAVVAETEDLARQVADATADGSLADDSTYQRWTEELGDPGVVTMYAAPEVGTYLADFLASPVNPINPLAPLQDSATVEKCEATPAGEEVCEETTDLVPPGQPEVPEEMVEAFEQFEGMAATLRFDDGALELEGAAGGTGASLEAFAADGAGDAVGSLPADTAAAFGLALPDGWFDAALDHAERFSGGEMTADQMLAELEAQTGLTGDDIETLLGESAVVALGGDVDPDVLFGSSDGSDVPVGARITGDSAAIQDVLEKIAGQAGGVTFLASDAEGDIVAVGPNEDYRSRLLEDGGLGDTDVFQNAVPDADRAGSVLFASFEGDWLSTMTGSDPAASENLEPLEGVGLTSWIDGETSHVVFRLTTD